MDFINIRIGQLPGCIIDVVLNGDRTVGAALEASELDAEGYEIRVDGAAATESTSLSEGQTVLLVKKVKGNA